MPRAIKALCEAYSSPIGHTELERTTYTLTRHAVNGLNQYLQIFSVTGLTDFGIDKVGQYELIVVQHVSAGNVDALVVNHAPSA